MKKIMISVKDTVAEIFHDTRLEINAASAIRAFTNSLKDNYENKDDYALYIVGEFDTQTGKVKVCEPQRIYTGHDIKTGNVTDINEAKS